MALVTWDPSKLVYTLKKRENGSKFAEIRSEHGEVISFQTTSDHNQRKQLICEAIFLAEGEDKCNLDLLADTEELIDTLRALDDENIRRATEHSEAWFGKQVAAGVVENWYTHTCRVKDGVNTMRVKLQRVGNRATNVWVTQDASTTERIAYRKGDIADLRRFSRCVVMVQAIGLWFMGAKSFGMTLLASDVIVWPNTRPTGIGTFLLPDVTLVPCEGGAEATSAATEHAQAGA